MAKNTVAVNGQSVVTDKSGGIAAAMPDVCKTPAPPGPPVPIPYPNIAQSSDLTGGSTSVKIGGASVMLKGSKISTSTGNEAGSLGGVASGKTKGAAEAINYSFDVKIEGKAVVRNFDLLTQNDKNTPPSPIMQAPVVPAVAAAVAAAADKQEEEEPKCEYCGKAKHPFSKKPGRNDGNSGRLGNNIMKASTGQASRMKHAWFTGGRSLAAHHLICCETMRGKADWKDLCSKFGYDIDRAENGVMLPMIIELACHLHVPVHISNHAEGTGYVAKREMAYPKAVAKLANKVKEAAASGEYCDTPDGFVDRLDDLDSAKFSSPPASA